jgi:hypothetical protein
LFVNNYIVLKYFILYLFIFIFIFIFYVFKFIQVTGISASSVVVVATSCPDCPTLMAHFDMSQEAATIIDGGIGVMD